MSLVAQTVKNLPAVWETQVRSLGGEGSPGGGNGNALRYSCLGNPMDRGDWRTTIHGVAKSWTRLSDTHSLFFGGEWGAHDIRCPGLNLPLAWAPGFQATGLHFCLLLAPLGWPPFAPRESPPAHCPYPGLNHRPDMLAADPRPTSQQGCHSPYGSGPGTRSARVSPFLSQSPILLPPSFPQTTLHAAARGHVLRDTIRFRQE